MKKLYKITALLLAACCGMIHIDVSAADTAQKCGDNITWRYDAATRTMYLEGTGDMYDFNLGFLTEEENEHGFPPWLELSNSEIEHVSVSDGITSVGDFALSVQKALKDVEIPESVRRIGKYAFAYSGIESLTLSAEELDDSAVSNCDSLCSVTLNAGLKRIGSGCFSMDEALSECEIPDTVTEIAGDAFDHCKLWNAAHTEPMLILGDGVLFRYTGKEKDLTIPETVKHISGGAFLKAADNIRSITIPDTVTELPACAFKDLKKLETVVLPKHLKSIGASAFSGCSSLKTISIPETVQEIGENAFSGCTSLQSLTVPQHVQHIGANAFAQTPFLESAGDTVILGDGILYCIRGRQKIVEIPENVRAVSSQAISGSKIAEISIPESVRELPADAIDCKNAVIAGKSGSIAAQYAAEHGIPFRDTDAVPAGRDMTFDYAKDGWSFANSGSVFGSAYEMDAEARQYLESLGEDTSTIDQPWSGSCVGMSVTAILMKNGFFSPAQLQKGAKTLSDVKASDAVLSFINYYHCFQGRDKSASAHEDTVRSFYRMIRSAENIPHGVSPFLITFSMTNTAHGVVGYGIESGEWEFDGKAYDRRILLWDSNSPDQLDVERCLYFDYATFDYCIPHYGIRVSDGDLTSTAGIIDIVTDLSILNRCPYPLIPQGEKGDLNLDGNVTAADAVLLCKHLTTQEIMNAGQMQRADLSGDKAVNAADLTLLKRLLLT